MAIFATYPVLLQMPSPFSLCCLMKEHDFRQRQQQGHGEVKTLLSFSAIPLVMFQMQVITQEAGSMLLFHISYGKVDI